MKRVAPRTSHGHHRAVLFHLETFIRCSSLINFLQVFRPEPSKSESTNSCSRTFPNFLSWWHRKWTSPAIILIGFKCHEQHLENPAKVKPGAASFSTFPVGECAISNDASWEAAIPQACLFVCSFICFFFLFFDFELY